MSMREDRGPCAAVACSEPLCHRHLPRSDAQGAARNKTARAPARDNSSLNSYDPGSPASWFHRTTPTPILREGTAMTNYASALPWKPEDVR